MHSIHTRGVTDVPGLYFELMPTGLNVTAEDIVAFLGELRRELPGPWTVVWDRQTGKPIFLVFRCDP